MVNFTSQPLYPRGKNQRYPLYRRLGGSQEPVWTGLRREKFPSPSGNRTMIVQYGRLSLCLTKRHAMKTYGGSVGTAPRILDLGTRLRWVLRFTPRPLYPRGKSSWYPLDRRLGGPQSRSWHGGEEKNSQPLPAIEPRSSSIELQYGLQWKGVKCKATRSLRWTEFIHGLHT
jgi:hypothetical protein